MKRSRDAFHRRVHLRVCGQSWWQAWRARRSWWARTLACSKNFSGLPLAPHSSCSAAGTCAGSSHACTGVEGRNHRLSRFANSAAAQQSRRARNAPAVLRLC
jgi:hypothetical protein